ncbi:hypothetical protein M569_04579 [Genlisea aurea]|uniref:Reduced growth phenotype protein 1 n=1 Tax=Genlisea aurea TaxID=192259 RepID=S8CYT0_9LAMI|nr:hypothetical protein M569_04579 [Genlisea aurea]
MPRPGNASRRFLFGIVPAPYAARSVVDPPHLKLEVDKQVHRPGDLLTMTISINNHANRRSLLIQMLSFECRGMEKLDGQWFSVPNTDADSQKGRGEYVFMDCSTPTIVTNQLLPGGATKTYVVRTILPEMIPPSYKGTTIRYVYYIRVTLSGHYLILENGDAGGEQLQEFSDVEARLPLQVWATQKTIGQNGEGPSDDIVPLNTIILDAYWKEKDTDSEWYKINEAFEGVDEGYASSQEEISSVASYNPMKEDLNRAFGSSLSLQSFASRSSTKGSLYVEGQATVSSNMALPRLSVTEILENSSRAEAVVRGRSYNIRLDDQVLLRFSPKNSDSTYYFSDTIGGTLTFFHENMDRRCLEMFITLESKETVNRKFVHPSRRHSPIITKIHSDHHEIVADLLQTSFLFSIPPDGPMSFSTRYVSVQWAIRFEFLTTPKNVDWTRFEHPLLMEAREKCEWTLPISVQAPSSSSSGATTAAEARNPKMVSWE